MSSGDSIPQLSVALTRLFPAGVACAELFGSGNPDDLLPDELRYVTRAVAKRREEFAAGRACARRALHEFGIADFALQAAEDRRPIWPQGIVGSITHTRGFCAAVVARTRSQRALGIDTERLGSVQPELWERICGPEMDLLAALPEAQGAAVATLIFSIKEAFYKCQYTLTGEFLGFDDARVELFDGLNAAGEFAVHACKPISLSQHVSLPLAGRYVVQQEFLTAGIAIT
jgi:4'-phosphopantetheinyl transferase EntD